MIGKHFLRRHVINVMLVDGNANIEWQRTVKRVVSIVLYCVPYLISVCKTQIRIS